MRIHLMHVFQPNLSDFYHITKYVFITNNIITEQQNKNSNALF